MRRCMSMNIFGIQWSVTKDKSEEQELSVSADGDLYYYSKLRRVKNTNKDNKNDIHKGLPKLGKAKHKRPN
jgi:hypothetical protein